jgi:hypothetical protein
VVDEILKMYDVVLLASPSACGPLRCARGPRLGSFVCVRSVMVKLVVQVKLLPTLEQAAALEATLHACNESATWVSEVAFERGEFKNFALRQHTYDTVKSRWPD